MKAYEVYYKIGGTSGLKEILLVENEEELSKALAAKAPSFTIDSRWDEITRSKEIPLSKVRMKDLSVTEFLLLMDKGDH